MVAGDIACDPASGSFNDGEGTAGVGRTVLAHRPQEEPGEELREKVTTAADMCPTAAITVEG